MTNSNYKVDSRFTMTINSLDFVIVTATFFRSTGSFTQIELYHVVDGLEMFQGYLRGAEHSALPGASKVWNLAGPIACAALNYHLFLEGQAAA